MADGLPPGVHFNAAGRVATVVFEGAGPDEAVLASLEKRLSAWGEGDRRRPGFVLGARRG